MYVRPCLQSQCHVAWSLCCGSRAPVRAGSPSGGLRPNPSNRPPSVQEWERRHGARLHFLAPLPAGDEAEGADHLPRVRARLENATARKPRSARAFAVQKLQCWRRFEAFAVCSDPVKFNEMVLLYPGPAISIVFVLYRCTCADGTKNDTLSATLTTARRQREIEETVS